MRIRKRQVPLPFSSLSPLPLSDPLLRRTPMVQLHPTSISPPRPPNLSHGASPPSDPPNLHPGAPTHAHDCATDHNNQLQENQVGDDGDEEEGKRNDTRIVVGAETSDGFLLDNSISSSQVVGRWCEREKAFPLKKRRASFEDATVNSSEKKTMKTKMNKKCTQNEDEDSKPATDHHVTPSAGGGKKRARGGALMEGSRCSRVNGRGWRCCQQTLVGYSLCEHHLGKGRLRSMNSVRSRSLAAAAANYPAKKEASSPEMKTSELAVEEEDEKKPLTPAVKKRMKLGVVKARSISSLLGQTDTVTAPPPDDNC